MSIAPAKNSLLLRDGRRVRLLWLAEEREFDFGDELLTGLPPSARPRGRYKVQDGRGRKFIVTERDLAG